MFVGNTGTGKTANIMSKLARMDPESMTYTTINMNSFSDAPSLQVMLEQSLEKKSGVRYGPPGSRRCVGYCRADELSVCTVAVAAASLVMPAAVCVCVTVAVCGICT